MHYGCTFALRKPYELVNVSVIERVNRKSKMTSQPAWPNYELSAEAKPHTSELERQYILTVPSNVDSTAQVYDKKYMSMYMQALKTDGSLNRIQPATTLVPLVGMAIVARV